MVRTTRTYLIYGIAAAKAGDVAEARRYLERLLILGGTDTEEEEALLWLSRIESDPVKKRDYLEEILISNPLHPEAQRELALLKGELKPEEIVNPDRLAQEPVAEPLCPRCGGRLESAGPDETERRCSLCGWYASLVPEALPIIEGEALFRQGVAAARAGDAERARQAFTRILNAQADAGMAKLLVPTWLWLSSLTEDLQERRRCLEAVLRLEPDHALARRGLEALDAMAPGPTPAVAEVAGKPSQEEQPAGSPLAQLKARRLVCPQCGGSMTAYGMQVRCEYCGYKRPILEAWQESATADEQSFVLALATAKGHHLPTGMGVLRCQACGAQYLLLAHQMSMKCAYCGSPHVIESGQMALIPPHGVIPMEVTPEQAKSRLQEWLEARNLHETLYIRSLSGVFLPVWTFDVGGELTWRCTIVKREGSRGTSMRTQLTGAYPLLEDDVVVPASHTLPRDLNGVFATFPTNTARPFAPEFVASWPVEIYSVTVSDASIVARSLAWWRKAQSLRMQIEQEAAGWQVEDLNVSTARMGIQSYKLVLVPLWVARYEAVHGAEPKDALGYLIVQGQTGAVFAPRALQEEVSDDGESWGNLLKEIGAWWRSLLERPS